MFRIIITSLLFLITTITAQDFGDVSDEWLELKEFSEDPDADAVILIDKEERRITKNFTIETYTHFRVKILSEKGKKYADVSLQSWKDDEFYDLEAVSYSPDGEEYELDDDNLFEEEIGNTIIYSFAIPGVEVGSIIEYEFTTFSENITKLRPWYFQTTDYILYSELSVILPTGFAYNRVSRNVEKYDITERVEDIRDPSDYSKMIKKYIFTGRNIPGIKNEPFMDNISDEYAKMIFILQSYRGKYSTYNFAKSWDDVSEEVYKIFYEHLETDVDLNEDLKQIFISEKDKLKRAKNIYNYLISKIKTTSHTTLFSSNFKSPENVLTDRSGSSSEKNMLLINLLRMAEINAEMIFISTRNNGIVIPEFSDPTQFNRLICMADINNKTYFLYTGNRANPFGYLPPNFNVDVGYLLKETNGNIIGVKPETPLNREEVSTEISFEENGALKLETEFIFKGYPAMTERNSVIGEDTAAHVKDKIQSLFKLAEIDTFYYENLDSLEAPLVLNVSYIFPEYVQQVGDLIYFSPPLFTNISENPFKRDIRMYPVCFDYKVYSYEKSRLNLPEDIMVAELPARKRSMINEYSFSKIYKNNDNYIEVTRSNNVKERIIDYRNYPKLKSIYAEIVSADQEQIVLTRTNNGSE